jgi:HPt (histidine-containing phosphotransfer) domain-containing protein
MLQIRDSAELVDWQGLERAYGSKPGLIPRLMGTTLESQRDKPGRLRAALAQGNLDELARLAHALRGVAGNLYAHPIAEHAGKVERAVCEDRSDLGEHVLALAAMVDRLLAELALRLSATTNQPAPMNHA